MPKPIDAVVLGLSPTGLYAVREAARAGYSVMGVGAPGAPGLWSRFLSERVTAASPEARLDAILSRFPAGIENKPALIVTSDQDLEAVIARADMVAERVHIQGSYHDGLVGQIMDKHSFYQMCAAHNVMYPNLWAVTVCDAPGLRDKIVYPVMVKPARIQDVKHMMGGKKGWILRNAADFDRTLPSIPSEAGTLLMQEIVPGPESNITLWCGYIDSTGEVRQRFTARKLRQYPPGFGSASLVQSEVCTETAETAERLLTEIGYRGIAAAEFKRHPDTEELKIIEVNPRPSLWFSISTKASVPLVETAIAEAFGKPLPPRSKQQEGVRWRYGLKDLASRLFYARTRDFVLPAPDLTQSGHVYSRADVVGALDDPLPALREFLTFIQKGTKRLAQEIGIDS